MQKVCKLYAHCVLKARLCRLDAHFVSLHYLVCTKSEYIVCFNCASAVCRLGAYYTSNNLQSVHIVCTNCVFAYYMHPICSSLVGVHIVCKCRLCRLCAHYLSSANRKLNCALSLHRVCAKCAFFKSAFSVTIVCIK